MDNGFDLLPFEPRNMELQMHNRGCCGWPRSRREAPDLLASAHERSAAQHTALAASLRRARQRAPHTLGPSWEAHAAAQELRRWLGPTKRLPTIQKHFKRAAKPSLGCCRGAERGDRSLPSLLAGTPSWELGAGHPAAPPALHKPAEAGLSYVFKQSGPLCTCRQRQRGLDAGLAG